MNLNLCKYFFPKGHDLPTIVSTFNVTTFRKWILKEKIYSNIC